MTLQFTVYGEAQPAGSKRAFLNKHTGKVIVTDDNPRSRPWKQEVAVAAREAMLRAFGGSLGPDELLRGPIRLSVTFYKPRPKGHYGTGKNAGTVKLSAPMYPTTKPDSTKLVRGLEDACTQIVWVDDAQVVDQYVGKRYGSPARAEVVVSCIDDLDPEG